jgi:hypothetical protein
MADPVSNQKRAIATKGTAHVAQNKGADDVLLNPQNGATLDTQNKVPTTRLLKGQTQRTHIDSKPIWTAKGEVGPPSDGGAPPFVVGKQSGAPFKLEAVPDTKSKDVSAEGGLVVRTDDITWQNRKNSKGYVDGSKLGEGFDNNRQFLANKCTLLKVEGEEPAVAAGKIKQGSSARPLGFPRGVKAEGEPYYIEVHTGDTVELTATRGDVTAEGEPGKGDCKLHSGRHTRWLIERSRVPPKKVEELGMDKLVIGPDWTDEAFSSDVAIGDPISGVGGAVQSFAAIVQFIDFHFNPRLITATAMACSGARKKVIKVLPKNKIDFSLDLAAASAGDKKMEGDDQIRLMIYILQNCKKVTECAAEVAKMTGSSLTVNFLGKTSGRTDLEQASRGATLSISAEYKDCENKRGCTLSHVGLAWELTLTLKPLIEVKWEKYISLAILLGAAVGVLAKKVLEWLKVGIFVVVSFSLEAVVDFSIGQDQHGILDGKLANIGLTGKFGLALAATGSVYEVRAGLEAVGKVNFGLGPCRDGKHLLELRLSGEVYPVIYAKALKNGDVKAEASKELKEYGREFPTATWPRLKIA